MSTERTWCARRSPMQFRLGALLIHITVLSFVLAILARGGPTIVVALLFPIFWTWGWMRIGLCACGYCVIATSRLMDCLGRNR